jgi:NAD(P)-dependent dehydrogenase (short-subunit alcohol dehydrogenase family)
VTTLEQVVGTLLSMKHELRVMQAQGSGSIINISSTYGHLGARGASVHAASKHAVEGLTKSAALEAAASGGAGQRRHAGANRDRDAQPVHRKC